MASKKKPKKSKKRTRNSRHLRAMQHSQNKVQRAQSGNHIVAQAAVESYSGPIPPPALFEQYEKILPGCAQRIMCMAENQQNHRIAIESQVVSSQQAIQKSGQKYAFWVAIIFAFVSGFCAFTGHDAVAATLGGTTVVSLVAAFIAGKHYQNKDLQKKNQ